MCGAGLRCCGRPVLSASPTHGHGDRELGVHTGSSALCSHRLYKIPRDDRREILVGVDQERDPHAEISGLSAGEWQF